MHFSLATILAASSLLLSPTLAAPLPNNDSNASGSCSTDSNAINVGVGVGNSIYRPSNGVKVKQGNQGSCPSGWTRSLLEVDMCIQVGGNDHKNEKQQARPDAVHRAVHAPSPYWGVRSTTTASPHLATHASNPQRDEWTPRGGSKKPTTASSPSENENARSSSRSSSNKASTSTSLANKVVRPTSSPASSTRCPEGQTLGTGSLMNVCLDIDTDPLYVGRGGIKLGGHNSPSPSSPSSSSAPRGDSSGSRSTSASPSPSTSPTSACSDDTTYDAFLGICVDIDTDPLFLGGGIKIGGSPRPQNPSSTSSRNGTPTPRPSSTRSESQQGSSNDQDLPECNGENDSRAFLGLCIDVGNLLGAKIKLGGSGSGQPTTTSAAPRSPQSTPYENPNKGLRGDQKNSNKKSNTVPEGDGSLPPCNGPDDPNAILDLCVQVGDLLGADVKIGGSTGPSSTTSARSSGRTPNNAKSSPSSDTEDNDGNILDLSLGNLLNAKIGSGPGSTPSSTTSVAESPTPTPRKVKQSAPIVTYPDNDRDTSRPNSSPAEDHEDTPLVSVSASAKVQLGPSSTQKPQRTPAQAVTPTPRATSNGNKSDCPVGQILHLGICVEADADVLGLVQASAAATVAV